MRTNTKIARRSGSNPDRTSRSPSKSGRRGTTVNSIATAKRNHERYITLARTAASTGDAVEVENLCQHAEHYLRLMRERESAVGQ